jgi:flagellar M-ring protein FliF
VRYEQRGMGGLRRLTVAVVVNYKRIVDKDGKVTVKPIRLKKWPRSTTWSSRPWATTRTAATPSAWPTRRSMASTPYEAAGVVARSGQLAAGQGLAKFLITALILLYIVLRIVRPMMRPVFKKIDEFNAPEPEPEEPEEVNRENEALIAEELRKMEENTARSYRENLAMAKKLAVEDPRIVANVIKEWIGAND